MGTFCEGCQKTSKGETVVLKDGWRVFVCPICGSLNVRKYNETNGEQIITKYITPVKE